MDKLHLYPFYLKFFFQISTRMSFFLQNILQSIFGLFGFFGTLPAELSFLILVQAKNVFLELLFANIWVIFGSSAFLF